VVEEFAMRLPAFAMVVAALFAAAAPACAASTEADYKAAYAAADAANTEAGKLRNQWTTAVKALADAKKAAEAGDFDKAVAEAKHSEELSKAAIYQAHEQETAWKEMEIH
jgi:hypothetical protein